MFRRVEERFGLSISAKLFSADLKGMEEKDTCRGAGRTSNGPEAQIRKSETETNRSPCEEAGVNQGGAVEGGCHLQKTKGAVVVNWGGDQGGGTHYPSASSGDDGGDENGIACPPYGGADDGGRGAAAGSGQYSG